MNPENVLVNNVTLIPNKVFGHRQADFNIILSNAISRILEIKKVDFRPVDKKEALRSEHLKSKNPTTCRLQNLVPELDREMLKANESVGVLLSLNKDPDYFVG